MRSSRLSACAKLELEPFDGRVLLKVIDFDQANARAAIPVGKGCTPGTFPFVPAFQEAIWTTPSRRLFLASHINSVACPSKRE